MPEAAGLLGYLCDGLCSPQVLWSTLKLQAAVVQITKSILQISKDLLKDLRAGGGGEEHLPAGMLTGKWRSRT